MRTILLTETHEIEFVKFMKDSETHLKNILQSEAEAILSKCYTDYGMYISSDAWLNYREELKKELGGGLYKAVTNSDEGSWAKNCRDMIFQENRAELIEALNQDLVKEIENLKEQLNRKESYRY